jgi:hypothetical protein
MKARLNCAKVAPGVYDAMDGLDQYLSTCGLDRGLMIAPGITSRRPERVDMRRPRLRRGVRHASRSSSEHVR